MQVALRFALSIRGSENSLAASKGKTMTWEDDALGTYERKKERKADADRLSSQRLSLIEGNASRMWNELRQAITDKCKELNQKAGRELLKSLNPRTIALEIRREDGEVLKGQFDSASKIATFSSRSFLFGERKYEVTSRSIDGNERAVWFETKKKDIDTTETIVRTIVTDFLHSGGDDL
jgi:hypothetical protein